MWLFILFLVVIWWVSLSILCYTNLQKIFKKYRNVLRIDTPEHYNAFLRMDFGKWNQKALLRRSYTVFPLRITLFSSFMTGYAFLAVLHRYIKFPGFLIDLYRRTLGAFAFRFCFKVFDKYDRDEVVDTPIVVSNHTTWIDIIYFGTALKSRVSFVAKREIASWPVISSIAQFLQALIVDRRSKESRAQTIQDIRDRVELHKKDPEHHFPVVIYPEGTVSNGSSLLNFKNGAFDPLAPITLFSLKYESDEFNIADVQTQQIQNFFLSFCVNSTLTVKRSKIQPKTNESIEQYRERCRAKVAEMGGFTIYNADIKDFFAYDKEYKQKLKEMKQGKATKQA